MPRLTKPASRVVQGNASISTSVAASAGLAQANASRDLEVLGKQFFEESKASYQNSEYTKAMSVATEQFVKESNSRYENPTDDKGNPTFQTLPDDIGEIGSSVRKSALTNIFDSEVSGRFSAEFDSFVQGQKIKAYGIAREQQLGFSKEALFTGIQNYKAQAIQSNPEQLGMYENQVQKSLDEAVSTGIITPEQRYALQDDFRSTVRIESYRNMIEGDPTSTLAELMGNDPSLLGLEEAERDRLVGEATMAVMDLDRQEQARQKELEKQSQDEINIRILEMKLDMEKGEITQTDIERARDSIGESNYLKLSTDLVKQHNKGATARDTAINLGADIDAGKQLTGYTGKQVNDHFLETVKKQADPQSGELPGLEEQAVLALQYRGNISSLSNRLGASVMNGTGDMTAELNAYAFLAARNPEAISGMSKTEQAIAQVASRHIDNTNMSSEDAIKMARESVLNVDEPVRIERLRESREEDGLEADEIQDFLIDTFEEGFGFNSVEPGVGEITGDLMRENFLRTGDIKDARALTKSQLKNTVGESSFNGGGRIMLHPPEKVYQHLSKDELHEDLLLTVQESNPEIDADNIFISTDAATRGTFVNGTEAVSYPIYTMQDVEGHAIPMPLINEDGTLVRWLVDEGRIMNERAIKTSEENAGSVEDARSKRDRVIKQQALFQ